MRHVQRWLDCADVHSSDADDDARGESDADGDADWKLLRHGGYADADEPGPLHYDGDADGAPGLLLWWFCFAERWPGVFYVLLPLVFSLGYLGSALRATPGWYFSVSRVYGACGELGFVWSDWHLKNLACGVFRLALVLGFASCDDGDEVDWTPVLACDGTWLLMACGA